MIKIGKNLHYTIIMIMIMIIIIIIIILLLLKLFYHLLPLI